MIAVSFLELLPTAIDGIGFFWGNIWFFVGIIFIFAIDIMIPHVYKEENEGLNSHEIEKGKIHKLGILTALGVGIHNLPEGLVTFVGSLESIKLGLIMAAAIAMHNIPEGLSVSIPLQAATGDRWYAFKISFLSGLAEPVGAALAAIILLPFISDAFLGGTFAFIAGIMVFISFDELLPAAKSTDESHLVSVGVIIGMMVISATLWMFAI
ncbi:MAG: ZIP family metal transporter [Candidatus Hodarchaeales archaeon]